MRDKEGLVLLPPDGGSADKRLAALVDDTAFSNNGEALPFVIFVATAWGPRFGGINSFNHSLARAVAESGRARVICAVSMGDEQDVQAASTHKVELLVHGLEPVDELVATVRRRLGHSSGQLVHWVGHDVHTGSIANSCAKSMGARSSVIHHMDYSSYSAIRHGSRAADAKVRQQREVLLAADHRFSVGPVLRLSAYMLGRVEPTELIPGLPEIASSDRDEGPFKVMIVGRLGRDDDAVKQVRLGVKAVAAASNQLPAIDWRLELVGVRADDDGYAEDSATIERIWTLETQAYFAYGILPFDPDQNLLFERLCEADLLIMPSLREGFGLVGWEAIGAGVPVAISVRSGLYKLLHENGYSGSVEPLSIMGRGVLAGEVDKGDVVRVTNAVLAVARDRKAMKRRAMVLNDALRRDSRFSWASCAATLLDALQVPSLRVVALSPPRVASLNNPFKQSLAHWTVNDEKRLPGRAGTIRDIVAAMANHGDLVLLKGRSGCGKSSLMQSGVMRRLREIDGSVPVPFRPTELMTGSGEGDELDRLTRLIAETVDVHFPFGGPMAMRPESYAKRLRAVVENSRINLVLGLDQFEEVIDELKLERERSTGAPQFGWWLVIRFLKALCGSRHIRLIATLESARETSFQSLGISEAIGLAPKTINVDATDDTVGEIAKSGFAFGGLPLDPTVIESIKRQWRAFEQETPSDNASPLPLACLFFHRLYERFADQAGTTADERIKGAFQQAGSREDDHLLTLEEIGGKDAISFTDIIQKLADEAWRAGGGNPAFADPIETNDNFIGLDNFLKPLVTVDYDGQMQLRAVIEIDADASTRRQRRAFCDRRLLVPVPGEGEQRLRPVHQALIDRWSPARRWLVYRKQQLQIVQRFRDEAVFWHRRGRPVPLEEDGSTLRAAAETLSEHLLDWQMRRGRPLEPNDAALRDQALAVFDAAEDPFTVVEGSPFRKTYAHLAANYHRVDLLRRFIAVKPECLKAVDRRGQNLLHIAAWSSGPAVSFLVGQGVPLTTAESEWNAISVAIIEKLNDNFDIMIGQLGLDDPIEKTVEIRMIHWAAEYGNMSVIDHLIGHGATLGVKDKYERTALHYAAAAGQVGAFRSLLPRIGVQEQDYWKRTSISVAAESGAAAVLSAYLIEEVDADRLSAVLYHRNNDGDTPLMIAVRHRQPESLRILLQRNLGDLGDPSANAHRSEHGDTLFHRVFRGVPGETLTEADRFRARTVVEILLQDGRLDPNLPNNKGERAFDLGGAFSEARRVLRQDARVPKDYAAMTPAMRIEDLSSRRPTTVLRLLEKAPQALTDEHEQMPSRRAGGVSARVKAKPLASPEAFGSGTGLDILIRLKNHTVLAALADDAVHWPTLRKEFRKLLIVAAVPSANRLRGALLRRFAAGEIGANEAGELLGVSVDAEDAQIARALIEQGAPLTLRRDKRGATVLHRAAITGDVDRFRSVLAIGPFAVPRDRWARRPSDLAAETLAETFRALEADKDASPAKKASRAVRTAIARPPPFLSLERDGAARVADEPEMVVLQREWNKEWAGIEAVDIHVFDLPFHPEVPLVDVRPRLSSAATGRLCFLLQGGKLHRLNGTSPPIHEVNGKEKPFINRETVLQYLTFFCFFVRGGEGPFLIVDRPDNGFLPDLGERSGDFTNIFRPPRVWRKNKQGYWYVSALVYYADVVFLADFSVQPGGMIEMVEDTPLLSDLPARIDVPLEIRSLR